MTKARFVITVLAVLTILGAAYASQLKNKYAGPIYCAYSPTSVCTITASATLTTAPYIRGFCSSVFGGVCTTYTYVVF